MAPDDFVLSVPRAEWNGRGADMRSRLVTWKWRFDLGAGRSGLLLDFTKVEFMEPWAMAMFGAYGLEMRRRGLAVRSRFDASPSNLYFVEMGLQELLEQGTVASAERWQGSYQNTGLHLVRDYSDLRRFKAAADRLALQHCPEAADCLRYAMDEMGRNVIQHSASAIGGVCIAQHFPDDRRLQVAVCDVGQGIRSHMKVRNPELATDMEALRLAVLPHASGAAPAGPYGGEQNSGLGLFCSSELAWRARGSMWLASGKALLGIRGDVVSRTDPSQPVRVYRTTEGWPGTAVVLDFPTDAVTALPDVLEQCSKLAAEARQMAGPAGLDFLVEEAEVENLFVVKVADFDGDNMAAMAIRDREILPRVRKAESVILDFAGVRAPAQSFVHALLAEAFSIPGSLVRLSFHHCSATAKAVLRMVAAYASYRRVVG